LAESLVLAVISAAAGLVASSWASRLLIRQLSTPTASVFLDLSPDWRMLAFAVGVAITTVVLFGVVPAVRASNLAPMDALKAHARGASGDRWVGLPGALVIGQVALSVVLVVAAGLLVRTVMSLMKRDPGFAREQFWSSWLIASVQRSRRISGSPCTNGYGPPSGAYPVSPTLRYR
jgi:putative ABC transport system permease protein